MTQQKITTKHPRWLKRLTIAFFLFCALIIALPYGIQYGIVKGLSDAGGKDVTVADVDFNPFTGRLSVTRLHANKLDQPALDIRSLSIQVDWLPLFSKRLFVSSLSIKDSSIAIEQPEADSLYIAGINIPLGKNSNSDKDKQPSNWGIGLNKLHLVNNHFSYQSADFSDDFTIKDLAIEQAFSWKPDHVSDFSFNTQLNKASLEGKISISMFSDKPLIKGQLHIKQLDLHDFQPLLKDHVKELTGLLHTDIQFSALLGNDTVSYQQTGSLSIDTLNISADGLTHSISETQWNGEVTFDKNTNKPSLTVNGDLALKQLSSSNPQKRFSLTKIENLSLKQLSINEINNIKISTIDISDLSIAQHQAAPAFIKSKQLLVNDVHLSNLKDITINGIDINTLIAHIDIDEQGDLPLLKQLSKSLPATPKDKTEHVANDKPLFHLTHFNINKNSFIKFTKKTSQGSVKKDIKLNHFNIGNINSSTPKTPTPIDINATIDEFSTLTLKGVARPFSKKAHASFKTKLTAFELHEFSPIIREQLGYDIQNGQLNADLDIDVKDNILKGDIDVAINQLSLEPADQDKMAKMTQQLSMPLDSALSLLRDDNDDIKLSIPVKGDVSSPDFNISDIINTALGNALQGTVKQVLKYALQPYGLIFMAAEKAYGVATAIKLDALVFNPTEHTLPLNAPTYLKRIGELMQKRPHLRIRVCGVATSQDVLPPHPDNNISELTEIQSTTLLTLADDRASAVKHFLMSAYNIKATRLFACKPQIEQAPNADKTSEPRVEFLI